MPYIQQFDTTMNLLQKVLDLRSHNQQIISSNIANAETPGYAASSFEFEVELKNAMENDGLSPVATRKNHIAFTAQNVSEVQGNIITKRDRTGIGDENSVRVDEEMINLSENQILYEAAITMLNKKLAILKYVSNDGR